MSRIKKFLKTLEDSKTTIMFLLGLALGIYGFNQYWSGYHDLDMAQNMIFLRDDIQLELWQNDIPFTLGQYAETTTKGYKISQEQLYYNGVLRLKTSVPMILLGLFMMGYYFRRLERGEVK